ncbi:MAG: helix-turn-helix domain-containing protein [Actinomycetia bacterium]|nr:helix-turn-helix domain-containing protein [Actinomycetes bacterium]
MPHLPNVEISSLPSGFPQLLSAAQAAPILSVSASTLNRWAARREAGEDSGPPFHAVGRKLRRWDLDELLAWLVAQKR